MKSARSTRTVVLTALVVLLVIGIAIQFIRPRLDNPPVTAEISAPPEVKAILQRACYNCHSNQTQLAWFDEPAPAYWLVASDVKKARQVLNFSTFDSLPRAQQSGQLYEALNQIEFHTMPLKQYALLHHGAEITADEIALLRGYLLTLAPKAKPDTAKQRLALEQYEKAIRAAIGSQTPTGSVTATGSAPTPGSASTLVPAEPKDELNGITYHDLAGFPGWKAISTTDRFDNGTLRLIMGNDIAVRAIREGNTHPWPAGATFAKVAWDQLPDSAGEVHAGAFKQVEFMIRDEEKYKSTDGWGFARWVGGLAMRPYGKDVAFTTECTICHQTMAANDHVFTLPIADTLDLYDQAAALPDSIAAHPLTGKVITTFVNLRDETMSTLYGNDIAVKSARSGSNATPAATPTAHATPAPATPAHPTPAAPTTYPPGSALALVTWSRRDDPHWFGGRIPKAIRSVEILTFGPAAAPAYDRYEGAPLAKKQASPAEVQARILYITGRKASVFP
jgi:Haem-binding domain/Cytochrome P460